MSRHLPCFPKHSGSGAHSPSALSPPSLLSFMACWHPLLDPPQHLNKCVPGCCCLPASLPERQEVAFLLTSPWQPPGNQSILDLGFRIHPRDSEFRPWLGKKSQKHRNPKQRISEFGTGSAGLAWQGDSGLGGVSPGLSFSWGSLAFK